MDAVQQADSGHPGTPMALAPLGYLLFTRHLKHDPGHPAWPDRDRFVLSAGHASMLLYSLHFLTGYPDVTLEEIRNFRQWNSKTPGHPEFDHTAGVETTTGPLGQGLANAVGIALAEAHLAAQFNKSQSIIDHYTWFIASDGDLMEGISHEAASLAGHLKLGKLIGFYDDNRITIDGSTDITFTDDTAARFESYGWQVLHAGDANDLALLDAAISAARADSSRPSLIIVRSQIAYGSPNKVNTPESHGAPLGHDEIRLTKEALGWPSTEPFHVPAEVLRHCRSALQRGAAARAVWEARVASYGAVHPDELAEFNRRVRGELPDGWDRDIPVFDAQNGSLASRAASGKVINALAQRVPELVGGSADLAGSNNTTIKGAAQLQPDSLTGRNVSYGVREHAMGAIMNGMSLHGGIIPFGGTFLIFSDYMRPAIRLAALMRRKVIYVFTHDSIGLGEDGPTHQPIEQLAALRVIPGLTVIRPADANETAEAWRLALRTDGPVALALSRQKLRFIDRERYGSASGVARGGYILHDVDSGVLRVVLIATGSEVQLAVAAADILATEGVGARVVSLPSQEVFAAQSDEYRNTVLPPAVPRIAVEAGHPMSWYRWVGERGRVLGLDHFGASAPQERLYREFGLTAERIVQEARELLASR